MKKVVTVLFVNILASIFVYSTVYSGTDAIYNVKAEIKEIRNRTLEAKVRDHKVLIDQPKAFGADDMAPTPPEMLAIAYGSCVVSTLQFLAAQRNLNISNISVKVEGSIDFSKAIGVSDKNRAGFSSLNVKVSFEAPMNRAEKEALMSDVFRVGAAIDNIQNTTPVNYEIIEIE